MLFLGDIMLARNVLKERNDRQADPWRDFDSLFHRSQWVMGNFEGAIGPSADCLADPPGPCFAVPESLAADLKHAGITAVSLANNHAMDLGAAGLRRTREVLLGNGLVPLDFGTSPWFRDIGGRKVAFLCLTLAPGKDGVSQALPSIEAARKFRLARRFAERVVVFAHWGTELRDWPNAEQIRAAGWMVRRGADLILGAHPHVVQAPACVGGTPVFYSLGNHLFDQKYPETKLGLIADCALGSVGFSCRSLWTEAPLGGFYPKPKSAGAKDAVGTICPEPKASPASAVRGAGDDGKTDALALESIWSGGAAAYRWRAAATGGKPVTWESRADQVLSAAGFRLRGKPGKAFLFRLERHYSPLDKESAPRPYVYELTESGPIARWRGSGLAWPLLDADMLPGNDEGVLCALHRGDSFLAPDPGTADTRLAAYRWNGFGFNLIADAYRQAEKGRSVPESAGTGPERGVPGSEKAEAGPENRWITECREVLAGD
jgi:poly-gamma-glutamate synthesis protein (capsule biosynthesis protein)